MKRAIVFGATGGIGQSICQELAKCGWSLYLHYSHRSTAANDLCDQLSKDYPQQDFLTLKLDFLCTNQEAAGIINNLLPVNAVVFAQGITKYGFLDEMNLSDVDRIMQVNLSMPIKLTKLLEPMLLKQEFSRIVYLGSVYGGQGSALESVYSATKAGLSKFSQAYAREIAASNLTVNVIAPGAVDTPMNNIFSKQTMQEVKDEIPAARLAQPQDISYWVKVLLNKQSSYLTGQTIYVSGGWLL